ncbi:MAG: hypothetical protein ACK5IQ_05880 [Bacteroidales bacterium]
MKINFLRVKWAVLPMCLMAFAACSDDDDTSYNQSGAGDIDGLNVGSTVQIKGKIVDHVPGTVTQFYLVDSNSDTVRCDVKNYANSVSYDGNEVVVMGTVRALSTSSNLKSTASANYVEADNISGLTTGSALVDTFKIADVLANQELWERQDKRLRLIGEITNAPYLVDGDDYIALVSDLGTSNPGMMYLEIDDDWINKIKKGDIITFAAELEKDGNNYYLELEYLIGENGFNPNEAGSTNTVSAITSNGQALDNADVTVELTGTFSNRRVVDRDDVIMDFTDATGTIACEIDDDYAEPIVGTTYKIWAEVDYYKGTTTLELEYYQAQ